MSGPLTLSVSYTYSRSFDNTSILTDVLPNAYDDRDYWGPSDLEVPQSLTFSCVYVLPFKGRNALIRRRTPANGEAHHELS
ncbi:MAG TPA: hypothetical protein VG345_01090 [Bryobacteraceae bacterium]|nr:hypothetical protein [Bryobacteraceae bacterium]